MNAPWLAFVAVVAALGLVTALRSHLRLRQVRSTLARSENDVVWRCGFKMTRPSKTATTYPLGRLHASADTICVRSVFARHAAYCVERANSEAVLAAVQGVKGLRIDAPPLEVELFVNDRQSVISRLAELGWTIRGPDE